MISQKGISSDVTQKLSIPSIGGNKVYYRQLDPIRAIAVFMVIIWHWFDKNHWLNKYLYNGEMGVTLFFVLSGFLITGILLNSKRKVENGALKSSSYYKGFYIRRTLRIFPIYYLLIFILWLVGNKDFLNGAWWHLVYASNIYFFEINKFEGTVSIFWSLSVEEQFYLIWPFLILSIPLRFHKYAYFLMILIALIFKVYISGTGRVLGVLLMPAQLDAFGIGALLALGNIYHKRIIDAIIKKSLTILTILLVAYVLAIYLEKIQSFTLWHFGFLQLIVSLISGLVIIVATVPINNVVLNYILNNKILIYLGRISYGLYLYHSFIPYFYDVQVPSIVHKHSFWIIQFLRLSVLIVIASISWYIIERPILKLKDQYFS